MSDRWWEYFESNLSNRHWLKEAVSQFQFMQPLYGMIQRYVPSNGKILDIGCGLGFNDLYLTSLGYQTTGIDNDTRIVEAAKKNAQTMELATEFKLGDAFDLKGEKDEYDLAYSIGVLEHFDREVTIDLLKEQSRCAEHVLICIPTKYTAYAAPITDERIYTIRELESIVKDAGLTVVSSFGFGGANYHCEIQIFTLLIGNFPVHEKLFQTHVYFTR